MFFYFDGLIQTLPTSSFKSSVVVVDKLFGEDADRPFPVDEGELTSELTTCPDLKTIAPYEISLHELIMN